MYRTHTNGQLNSNNINETVTLSGWVQKIRNKGFMIWVDIRDRYGITQLIFDEERTSEEVMEVASKLGREFVIQITGKVIERPISYYADFVVVDNNNHIEVEDVKGYRTEIYKIKRKLMLHVYGIKIKEI